MMDKYTFIKIDRFSLFYGFNNKKHLKQKLRKKKFGEEKILSGVTTPCLQAFKRGGWVFVTTYNKQNWYAFCPFSTSPKC